MKATVSQGRVYTTIVLHGPREMLERAQRLARSLGIASTRSVTGRSVHLYVAGASDQDARSLVEMI